MGLVDQKGLMLIPSTFTSRGPGLATIGLGKGCKLHDKRAVEKNKQIKKDTKEALRSYEKN